MTKTSTERRGTGNSTAMSLSSNGSTKAPSSNPLSQQAKSNNGNQVNGYRNMRSSSNPGKEVYLNNPAMSSQITLEVEDQKLEMAPGEELNRDLKNKSEEFPTIKGPEEGPGSKTSSLSDAKIKRSKSDNTGLMSSIINAAHNAANMISPPTEGEDIHQKEHTFSHKLDNLLRPSRKEKAHLESAISSSQDSGRQSLELDASKSTLSLSPVNVQFESVRESPLNTLGNGDLDLKTFDERPTVKRSSSRKARSRLTPSHSTDNIDKLSSPEAVNRNMPPHNQLTVSGDSESKRVHRKLLLGRAMSASPASKKDGDMDDSYDSEINSDEESYADADNLDSVVDVKSLNFASKKRNKEFHHNFKGIPSPDRLIEDFGCAFSKDILVHGRLYLSEHYLCFNSNILGWVTNLVIPLQEIIQIEKKSTAMLFPNGLVIRTLHQKYVFASFLSRDSTFSLITSLWHRVLMENSGVNPNKLIKISSEVDNVEKSKRDSKSMILKSSTDIESDSSDLSDEDFSDETGDITRSSSKEVDSENDLKSRMSDKKSVNDFNVTSASSTKNQDTGETKPQEGTFKGLPLIGPLEHGPVSINYEKQPNETFIAEETFLAPLGVIFLLLFGDDTSYYIKILKAQKNFSISESAIKGLSQSKKERKYDYIKPLGGPIGPKQTKCLITDKLIDYDIDNKILVEQWTSTPDVPSGNSFQVKTRLFFSWANDNSTKMYVLTSVEWTGKSWIKSAVEKGSIDGQKDSMKTLIESIKDFIVEGGKLPAKGKRKGKRRKSIKEKTPEPEVVEPVKADDSITEQISHLISSIGKLVPFDYVSDFIKGILLSFVIFYFALSIYSRVFGSKSAGLNADNYDNGFFIVPSVDRYLNNKKLRGDSEADLWDWIGKRSDSNSEIKSRRKNGDSAGNESIKDINEIKEIIRLTQARLNEINDHLVA